MEFKDLRLGMRVGVRVDETYERTFLKSLMKHSIRFKNELVLDGVIKGFGNGYCGDYVQVQIGSDSIIINDVKERLVRIEGEEKMEFDKSKILTVVTADQAKVGQKGWFGNNMAEIEDQYENVLPSKLTTLCQGFMKTFEKEDGVVHYLFYPALEPTYAERQTEWARKTGLKVGDKVIFIKGFEEIEDGSLCCKHPNAKGKTGTILRIGTNYINVALDGKDNVWCVPYTALEIVKEEKQENVADTLNEAQREYMKKCIEKGNVILLENITESLKKNGINPITTFSVLFDAVLMGSEFDKLREGKNGK